MPSSGLWERAKPGWRSEADMQRAEAWRAEANVKREDLASPDPRVVGRVAASAYHLSAQIVPSPMLNHLVVVTFCCV